MTNKNYQDRLSKDESNHRIANSKLTIERIIEIINRLTSSDGGCPWDQAQTNSSLVKYTIEEAYEVADSIENHSPDEICNELGDLLFNVLFHIHIASKNGLFTLNDVIDGIIKKMISRHPHVFGKKKLETISEVNTQWEEIKNVERNITKNSKMGEELDNIPTNIPALTYSMKLQKKLAKIGFDWHESLEIINKIYEEIDEFLDENERNNDEGSLDELGDILFSVVNLARYNNIDPETALRSTNRKFIARIVEIESRLSRSGKDIKNTDTQELNLIWNQIKHRQ